MGKGRRSGIARCRSQGILHKGQHRPLLNWLLNSLHNWLHSWLHSWLHAGLKVGFQASLGAQPISRPYSLAHAKWAGDQGFEGRQPPAVRPLLHQTLGHGLIPFCNRRQQTVP